MSMATVARALCVAALVVQAGTRPAGAGQVEILPPTPRDAPARASSTRGTAAIHGTVTSSGRPVSEAQVTVSGPELQGSRTVRTDDDGRFAARQLPAGRYMVTANKPGYLNVAWGQRHVRGAGRPVYLADGEARQLAIDLPRAGVITGSVVNDRGDPMTGVHVQAFLRASINGQRTLRGANGAATDDRGAYRLHSLQPGEYVVCASWMNAGPMTDRQRLQQELQMLRRVLTGPAPRMPMTGEQVQDRVKRLEAQLADAPVEPMRGYAPACAGEAGIPLAASEERAGVDLHLQRVDLGWLEGMVVLPDGVNAREVNVALLPARDAGPMMMMNAHIGVDDAGRFMRDGLVPGDYKLQVQTRSMDGAGVVPGPGARRPAPGRQPPGFWASADVTVDAAGTSGIVLELQPAATVSGEIVFDGRGTRPPDLTRPQVVVSPTMPPAMPFRPMMSEMAMGQADADGRFTINGVFPGSYRVNANLPGWHLTSAVLGDRELLDFPLEVQSGHVSGITLTFSDRATELVATVVDARGQPALDQSLVLFAADDRYWTPGSRRVRMARANPDGTFTFRALPAGEYRVAALVDFDPGELGSREFLQQLAWSATRVTLADGETARVALRVQAP